MPIVLGQVAPSELEQTVMQHEGVADVAVVGVPHPTMGEAPRAFIVLKPSARVTTSQIQSFVAGQFDEEIKYVVKEQCVCVCVLRGY